ncbi:MAG: SH3 domain-containing protein, partial [Chthoniobacterales bacterium]
MNTRDAIAWFKKTFGSRIAAGIQDTPFGIDLVVAIATQETCYIWSPLVEKGLSEKDVLRLCVGDTLDADKGRGVFPRTKDELLSAKRGAQMFAIARDACVEMAKVTPGYGFVFNNPNKFCHGFGIFQYDIQFFRNNPDFFLQRRWEDFGACLAQLVTELKEALARQGWSAKDSLTDDEQVFVAIAYNKGTANPSLGFKQGHKSD